MSLIVVLLILLVVVAIVGAIFWQRRVVTPVTGVAPINPNGVVDSTGTVTVPGLGANDGTTPPTA